MLKVILTGAIILCFFLVPDAVADTIELKDGRRITGTVVKETEEIVIISKGEGSILYSVSKGNVKNITKSPAEEAAEPKEAPAEKIKSLWQRAKHYFAKITGGKTEKEIKEEDRKKALLEKYEREVQATKKARREKAKKESEKKKKSTSQEEISPFKRPTCPRSRPRCR